MTTLNFEDKFQRQVAIVGAGTMGAGIAELFLQFNWRVDLVDKSLDQLEIAHEGLSNRLGEEALGSLTTVESLDHVPQHGFVIESVPEDLQLKVQVLTELEDRLSPRLLCSNTSSLSISEIQSALGSPENFLGLHFFQPVPNTGLIEIIRGRMTSSSTLQSGIECAKVLQRRPVVVKDSPGFATSRLGVAIGLEAMRMLEEGIASADDIDAGMQLGYGHEVGPLRMSDLVGLDVRLAISQHLEERLGPRFKPPQILRKLVSEGKLGRKAGQGFFEWNNPEDEDNKRYVAD